MHTQCWSYRETKLKHYVDTQTEIQRCVYMYTCNSTLEHKKTNVHEQGKPLGTMKAKHQTCDKKPHNQIKNNSFMR